MKRGFFFFGISDDVIEEKNRVNEMNIRGGCWVTGITT